MTILKAKHLVKKYGVKDAVHTVIDDISLNIEKGDFIALSGQSGSGKSTLLYLLSGLESPDSGKVLFENKDLEQMTDTESARLRRTKIGFCYQFHNLIHNLSLLENIVLPRKIDYSFTKSDEEFLQQLVEIADIKNVLYKLPAHTSGGEQQRAAIVRALLIKPNIIFLDEPTGNLDSKNAAIIMQLLSDINKRYQTAIVVATHSKELSLYAKKIINIKDGQINV